MRRTALGFCLCGLAMVTVGSTVVASKLIGEGLPPFTAAALRFGMALPVFLLLMFVTRTIVVWPNRRDALLLLAQAALGSVGYMVLLMLGLVLTSAADAGIVAGTLTAVVAALAVVLLRERLNGLQLCTVVLASMGVLVVTIGADRPGGAGGIAAIAGNALVLGAVVCEAVFLLLNKRLQTPLGPLAQSTVMTALGLLLALPFAVLERAWDTTIDMQAVMIVAYYALVPTVAGFLLWYAGAAMLTGAQASLTTAILPISAVLLAALVLAEPIENAQMIGMVCVLGAVIVGAFAGRGKATKP